MPSIADHSFSLSFSLNCVCSLIVLAFNLDEMGEQISARLSRHPIKKQRSTLSEDNGNSEKTRERENPYKGVFCSANCRFSPPLPSHCWGGLMMMMMIIMVMLVSTATTTTTTICPLAPKRHFVLLLLIMFIFPLFQFV